MAAVVTADCIIEPSGLPNACRVISNTGSPAYAQRVMAWLTGPHPPRYTPARRHGVSVREHHRWAMKFEAPLDKPATVDVSCLIETSGLPDHCWIIGQTGDPSFASNTLDWLAGSDQPHYAVEMRNGLPVAARHQWRISYTPPPS